MGARGISEAAAGSRPSLIMRAFYKVRHHANGLRHRLRRGSLLLRGWGLVCLQSFPQHVRCQESKLMIVCACPIQYG